MHLKLLKGDKYTLVNEVNYKFGQLHSPEAPENDQYYIKPLAKNPCSDAVGLLMKQLSLYFFLENAMLYSKASNLLI